MPNELDFPKRLMVVALSAAFPVHAFAQQPAVARVDFATGNVTAVAPGGATRPVSRGSEIRVGETVNTQEGRAQMRFTDGAFVSLQPQTEFKVENYVFEGRSTQNESALMNLIKGGMRTITGLIGKTNRDGYKLQTSTATVGIRGTEFTVSYNADGSITAFVAGGAISVANQSGTSVVPGGKSVSVSSQTSAPQTTDEKPFLPPSGSTPTQIAIQTNVVQDAAPISFQPLLTGEVPGAGIASFDPINLASQAFGPYKSTYFCEGPCATYDYNSSATLNATGGLTAYSYSMTEGYFNDPTTYTTAVSYSSGSAEVIPGGRAENIALTGGGTATVTTTLVDGVAKGNDGVIAWGEWTNGFANRTTTYLTNGQATATYLDTIDLRGTVPALYVVGAPAVMPTSGSAQYLMMGAITSCAPNCYAAVLGSKLEV
ncbi:MAG: FecR family protein, partial [Rhodospirillaceae bacterium]|nr:FecR family protein [Rhodospirillaceae bacterium]